MNNCELKPYLKAVLSSHHGHSMAITSRELGIMTSMPDRKIRLTIEDLVDDGVPIVSTVGTPPGYFIPQSIEEAQEYTKSLRSRAVLIFLRRRKVIKNTALYLAPAVQGKLI